MPFCGIALGANQAAGKDTIANYLLRTRKNARLMRSKTPIVQAFEKRYQIKYVKSHEMDAMLIEFSENIARKNDPLIVANWLREQVPVIVRQGALPVIADMRFHNENDALLDHHVLCVHIAASEDVRMARILKRDGDLSHYNPGAHTEVEIPDLKYHYEIDNNRDDGGKFAIYQLESFLRRQGATFRATPVGVLAYGVSVQVIDVTHPQFYRVGYVLESGPLTTKVRFISASDGDVEELIFSNDDLALVEAGVPV